MRFRTFALIAALLGSLYISTFFVSCARTVSQEVGNDGADALIQSQSTLAPDRKLSLTRHAQRLRTILKGTPYSEEEELRDIECMSTLSGPYSKEMDDLELVIEGKVLNTPAKIRKFYDHEATRYGGRVIAFPKVTLDECRK